MTWIEALILGVIQGLTEFLPVSSSGHLEIGTVLLGIQTTDHLLFAVMVHAATALSTVMVYRVEIREIILGLFDLRFNESWEFAIKIVISMIPVGIVGVFFEEQVEVLFSGNLILVGSMLIFTALLLYLSQVMKQREGEVSYAKSLVIGLAQAVAILPGISRSGSTIATALLIGIDKKKATRFSFLMVLPPILGACLLKIKDYLEEPAAHASAEVLPLVVGFIAAFVSGYIACKWMIGIVRRGKLTVFSIYCLVVGLVALLSQIWI